MPLSCLKSPYELGITLDNTFIENGYIHCSYLGPIEDGYYYIVDDTFPDYITELREKRDSLKSPTDITISSIKNNSPSFIKAPDLTDPALFLCYSL